MRFTIGVLILWSMLIVGTHGALDAKTKDPQAMAFHQADVGAALEKGWTVLTVELPPDTANSWHYISGLVAVTIACLLSSGGTSLKS